MSRTSTKETLRQSRDPDRKFYGRQDDSLFLHVVDGWVLKYRKVSMSSFVDGIIQKKEPVSNARRKFFLYFGVRTRIVETIATFISNSKSTSKSKLAKLEVNNPQSFSLSPMNLFPLMFAHNNSLSRPENEACSRLKMFFAQQQSH